MLRVRDPRITRDSLAVCCAKNRPTTDPTSTPAKAAVGLVAEDPYSWKRATKVLNMELADVQRLISVGQLKLVDTFVTDRSFEDFCSKHGSEINLSLMDPATKKWLISEYGISETANGKAVPRAQKHALVIRECNCGRKIAGNVYFRHVRHCHHPTDKAMDRLVWQ
jgi:hypothetical protein